MAAQPIDELIVPPCQFCAPYNRKFYCKSCVIRSLSSAQARATLNLEKQVRFLRAFQPSPLSEDFRGDVTFVGRDGKPVYAHRFIMAGKSAVFQRMLDTDMKERNSGTIFINDANSSVLKSVVKYCYTADIDFTEEAPAEEILKVAHKYDIVELKGVCEDELSRGLDTENFCTRAMLAQIYDAGKLDAATSAFFRANFDKLYLTVIKRLCKYAPLNEGAN
ncbi:hypothetical protein R1flu_023055 [Riccia fluitans]|uniref:BTB domain-containing protein n=1 Tax=Riccia fluitans TaxID=41844 RepID=A0ABD1XQY0_9MARC